MGVLLSRRSLIVGIPALIAADRLMKLSILPFYPERWVQAAENFGWHRPYDRDGTVIGRERFEELAQHLPSGAIYHPKYQPKIGEIVDIKHPGALSPGNYKVLWQETGKRNSSLVWNHVVKIA